MDARLVDYAGFLDDSDRKTCQVVVLRLIHARHFSRFPANQCAACQLTTHTDAGNNLRCYIDIQATRCVVIQKEQGFGAAHDQIVNTHCHKINAYGVVFGHLLRQHELGADAIGGCDQYRLLIIAR